MAVARGDLAARLEVRRDDEIGRLAQRVRAHGRRDRRARPSAARAAADPGAIVASLRAAVVVIDGEGVVRAANAAAARGARASTGARWSVRSRATGLSRGGRPRLAGLEDAIERVATGGERGHARGRRAARGAGARPSARSTCCVTPFGADERSPRRAVLVVADDVTEELAHQGAPDPDRAARGDRARWPRTSPTRCATRSRASASTSRCSSEELGATRRPSRAGSAARDPARDRAAHRDHRGVPARRAPARAAARARGPRRASCARSARFVARAEGARAARVELAHRPEAAAGRGRRGADPPGAAQPAAQRARGDAARAARSTVSRRAPARAAWRSQVARSGEGIPPERRGAALRSVLLDQGARHRASGFR